MTDRLPKIQRTARVAQAFTPGAPVDSLDLLAGRALQLQDVVSTISQKGRHVALYGERGVGKTSLASILAEVFSAPDLTQFQVAIVNCSTDDTFATLWRTIYRELGLTTEPGRSPEAVRYDIAHLDRPALIVIDELDRLEDDDALTLLADTIKTFSDHAVQSTIVLVGVAHSVSELIGEHASIVRALVQVEMPRMSTSELLDILHEGCARAQLEVSSGAADRIAALSQGLPTTPTCSACTPGSASLPTTAPR